MARIRPARITSRLVSGLTAYAAEDDADFVIPSADDLAALDDEALAALSEEAVGHFDALYGDGQSLAAEDLAALAALTDGIESLNAESASREQAAAERAEAAAALAARVRPADALSTQPSDDEDEDAPETDPADEGEPTEPAADPAPEEDEDGEGAAGTVTAAATPARRPERRINIPVRSRSNSPTRRTVTTSPTSVKDVMFAAGKNGAGIDFVGAGRVVDNSLRGYNHAQYEAANKADRHIREQHNIAVISKPIPSDLMVGSTDRSHIDDVFARAVDQSRLVGGSLVAAGGWCAPSEVLYDLLELESRDGLFSAPEIGVSRGGFSFTTGPDFSEIFANTGFCFTEDDDIGGLYARPDPDTNPSAPNIEGAKPCYRVPCPDFEEVRLDVCGLCITAGLLQARGYPEVIARTIRGAMVAHDHKMAARKINAIAAGSTAVTMPADQVGATAPVLTAIELQAEHVRYVHRLARGTTLEGVFPYWVNGVVRSDLSRRLGIDLFDVSDARISGWFTDRGIAAQFVYNYQDLTGAAGSFTAWPTTVEFLLYPAGTWVFGTTDVITLDTIYDSILLGQNDFTALFTEEGFLAAKRGLDSRKVTVSICPDGATHGGVLIDCNGSATPATP